MRKKIALILTVLLTATALMVSGCGKQKIITITYAAWNLGSAKDLNMERRMVASFMKANPNIHVTILEDYTTNYNNALASDAADNTMPDVFMYSNIADAYSHGWCKDLTGYISDDTEWSQIPQVLQNAASRQGQTVAIPMSYYFYGYYYNEDLLSAHSIADAYKGLTLKQFQDAIVNTTSLPDHTIGVSDDAGITDWYSAAVNHSYGWYSWDGGKFNLTSDAYLQGVHLAKELNTKGYIYTTLSEDAKKNIPGANDSEAWAKGATAFRFDGTWSTGIYSALTPNIAFMGLPGKRVCLVPDFLFVSSKCKQPEAAYQFAKYMSAYSGTGFAERIHLADTYGYELTSLPMTEDSKLLDAYFSRVSMKGIRETYDHMGTDSYVEMTKILPGYADARWNYVTNITVRNLVNAKIGEVITGASRGLIDFALVSHEINYLANTCIKLYPQQLEN